MSPVRRLPLWAISLLAVLGLHAGLYYLALLWKPALTPVLLEPAAMLIELSQWPPRRSRHRRSRWPSRNRSPFPR